MDIGFPELLVLLVIVLLIFGPGRIVNLSRELGKGIREFREGLGGAKKNDDEETTPGADSSIGGGEARKE